MVSLRRTWLEFSEGWISVGGRQIVAHPCVEDLDGGGLVDDAFLLASLDSGSAKFLGGAGCRQCFIDKHKWERGESLLEASGKGTDFRGGAALAAIHADGESDDERVDFPNFCELGDPFEGVALALVDGFHRMGEDAEIICRGDADASVAVVDAERGMRRV